MTVVRSLVLGLALAFVTAGIVAMAGLVWGVTVSAPGLVELESGTEGTLRADLELSPLALLLMAAAFTAVVWLIGRATRRRV
jgi:hypothetical protein